MRIRRVAALACTTGFVIALLLALDAPLEAVGAPSLLNGVIVFQRSKGEKSTLYSIRSNGSGTKRLISGKQDREPTFSADGRQLAFVRSVPSRTKALTAIYTVRADGSHLRKLTSGTTNVGSPVFSPDGRRIAFTGLRSSKHQEFVGIMNADGSHRHTLRAWKDQFLVFTDVYGGRELAFSPDGKTIAFGGWKKADQAELFAMDTSGKHVHQLTHTSGSNSSWGPWFSPDGTKIVFTRVVREQSETYPEVFVMNADGSRVRQLTGRDGETTSRSPVFSPDGTQIAYVHDVIGNSSTEVFIANADGSSPHRLTRSVGRGGEGSHMVSNDNPTWQPVARP